MGTEFEEGQPWCPICDERGHIAMDCPEVDDDEVE